MAVCESAASFTPMIILKCLEDSRLLTVNRDMSDMLVSLDAHPLLREYFAKEALKNYCARSSCVEIRLKMLIYIL